MLRTNISKLCMRVCVSVLPKQLIDEHKIPIFPSFITLVDICDSRIDPAFVSLKTRQAMILTMARYGLIPIDLRGMGTVGAYTKATVAMPNIIVILEKLKNQFMKIKLTWSL